MEKSDVKKLTDELDNKLFSNKIFNKIYIFLSYWLILTPIMETVLACLGVTLIMIFQTMFISVIFFITKILEISFNYKKINFKNKTIIDLLLTILFGLFILTSVINNVFNTNFFYGICYFACFIMIFGIDKKHYKNLIFVFVIEMVLDTIIGFIDVKNVIIPGFGGTDNYIMSLQFQNPNWSGFVMIIAAMFLLWYVYNFKKPWQKTLSFLGFIIVVAGIFVAGSFAPETALFLSELGLLIFVWIKNKKLPLWILICFLTTIAISFIVWFLPVTWENSTAAANYFYEALAVIDGKLKTHFVKDISTFFNKLFGWDIIFEVAGSNGWTRNDLMGMAFSAIFANAKSCLFGYGSAYIYNIRVHNVYVVLWLEFGIFTLLLFISIIVLLFVKYIKIKKNENVNILFFILCGLLFNSLYCCIEPYSFIYFVIISAMLYKELCCASQKEVTKNEEK